MTRRVCLCGAEIPAYGKHDGFNPKCRHCERTLLNYKMRELDEHE